jgi:general secretion pathway protein H
VTGALVNAESQNVKTASGFTLLEILVVMVIAGLLIALVPPLFSGAVTGTRLKGSVRDLAVVLRETRSKAIIHNAEQRVHLDLETPRYRVGNAVPEILPDDVEMAVELVTGARVDEMSQHIVRFFPDGSSSGELITLSGSKRAYHLHINWLTGGITITEGLRDAG